MITFTWKGKGRGKKSREIDEETLFKCINRITSKNQLERKYRKENKRERAKGEKSLYRERQLYET